MEFEYISALKEQHGKLKQHAADLETALSQRESTLVQLNAANQAATRKHDQTDEEQRLKLRQLEEDLTNQTAVCDSLQQQVQREYNGQALQLFVVKPITIPVAHLCKLVAEGSICGLFLSLVTCFLKYEILDRLVAAKCISCMLKTAKN